jgi:uncharacterized protein YndB with AHSA1/START domain
MQVNRNAPVFQSNEILIQASPERVWAVLTDINQWPSWNPKISRAAIQSAPMVGAKFNWKIKGASIRSILHTVETIRAFGWSGVTFGGSAIHNWYLENKNGHTLVRVEESMEGWLVGLFKKKMNADLALDMAFWLKKLKLASEN